MKRVLQHRKTGLFVSIFGGLTREVILACPCPTLADATLLCTRLKLDPANFVYCAREGEDLVLEEDVARPSLRAN